MPLSYVSMPCVATLLCLQAAAAPAGLPDTNAARRALAELFAQDEPTAAGEQIDAVLAACGNDPAAVKKLIEADTAYEAFPPGSHRRTVRIQAGKAHHDVDFVVRVPRSYRPGRPHALLLAAHGQGSSGPGIARVALRMLGRAAEDYVVVAPTMPGPRGYTGQGYQEQAYLRPLQWARRHLNVDDDRIAITGYSQGGHCTWHLAALYPRHFAAAVPLAGAPVFEGAPHTATLYLENLSNLRMWAIWGERDRPAPPAIGNAQLCRAATERLKELGIEGYRGTELRGVGHGGCWPDPRGFAAFLAAGRRRAVPEKVAHVFHLDAHRRGYYLEAVKLAAKPMRMDRRIRVPFSRRPSEPSGERAMANYFRKFLFGMWGELDRAANALTVRMSRVSTVRIYVTEGLFDLSRPVTLRVGHLAWRGPIRPSARCMVRHYAAQRDQAGVVYNEIDLTRLGRARVRYNASAAPGRGTRGAMTVAPPGGADP